MAGETGGGGERGGERNKGVERNNLVLGTRKSFMEGEGIGGRGGEGLSLSAPVEEVSFFLSFPLLFCLCLSLYSLSFLNKIFS